MFFSPAVRRHTFSVFPNVKFSMVPRVIFFRRGLDSVFEPPASLILCSPPARPLRTRDAFRITDLSLQEFFLTPYFSCFPPRHSPCEKDETPCRDSELFPFYNLYATFLPERTGADRIGFYKQCSEESESLFKTPPPPLPPPLPVARFSFALQRPD